MRVLLMGGPGPTFDEARRQLEAGTHEVVTCHDSDEPVFPCKGFRGDCPLDAAFVDAAVVVRNHAWPRPTAFDRGTTCAIRQRVPVLVAGVSVLNPYEPWTDAVVSRSDDLVGELEAVTSATLTEHSNVATEALRRSLEMGGVDPGDAEAVVTRREGWLRVEVLGLPQVSRLKQQNTARRVVSALRTFDRHARGIDVELGDAPSTGEGIRWAADR